MQMTSFSMASRLTVIAAGLAGAGGIAAAAGASHGGGGGNLSAIAMVCLAHGPALLALGLAARGRIFGFSALLLALGTLIFCADLLARQVTGAALVGMMAPVGGVIMIGGWLAIIVAALLWRGHETAKFR